MEGPGPSSGALLSGVLITRGGCVRVTGVSSSIVLTKGDYIFLRVLKTIQEMLGGVGFMRLAVFA